MPKWIARVVCWNNRISDGTASSIDWFYFIMLLAVVGFTALGVGLRIFL